MNDGGKTSTSAKNGADEESLTLKSLLGHDSNLNCGGRVPWFFDNIWQEQCAEFRWKNRQSLLRDGSMNNGTYMESNHWNDTAVMESPYEEIIHKGWNVLVQLLGVTGSDLANKEHTAPLLFKEQSSVTSELKTAYNNNLFAAYLDGCSIVLNHADWRSPWIAALCQDLQRSFPHAFANVYITPPGSQAVRAHADDRDVFVIQVVGQKSWKVYQKVPIPYPYPSEQVGKEGLEVPQEVLDGPTVIETTLSPGDVLYMPRGYVHEARANDQDLSFHVTIALATHDWTLAGIITNATQNILHNVIDYRKSINRKIGMRDLQNISTEEQDQLQKQIQEAMQLVQEQVTVASISSNQGHKFQRHNARAFSARMNLMHDMRFPTTNGPGSATIVGRQAAENVSLDTLIRAATEAEKESVMMDQPRGLRVREEVADDIIHILQALKTAPPLGGSKGKVAVKDLKSLLKPSRPALSAGADLICEMTLLSFVKVCVEQGALAVVN